MFQLACENLSSDFFIIHPAAQMILAGFSSAGACAKSCSKLQNGSNLMESTPDFFGSLESLIRISPALNIVAQSDGFNRDSLELGYASVIDEDLELTLIMPVAWQAVFH